MRVWFILISLLTVLTSSTAQKADLDYRNLDTFEPDGQIKGIGLVAVDLGSAYFGKDLTIYDQKGKPKVTIRVTNSDVTTKLGNKSYSQNDNSNPFNPRFFGNNPDYFVLIFDCTKKSDKYYQVILDQKTNETGFIKKADSSFKFETVSEYVSEWTTLGLDFDRTQNPLRQDPSDNATVISNDDQKKYKVWRAEKIEIKGDWLNVKIRNNEQGWIRWRQGDRILIRLYFAC